MSDLADTPEKEDKRWKLPKKAPHSEWFDLKTLTSSGVSLPATDLSAALQNFWMKGNKGMTQNILPSYLLWEKNPKRNKQKKKNHVYFW